MLVPDSRLDPRARLAVSEFLGRSHFARLVDEAGVHSSSSLRRPLLAVAEHADQSTDRPALEPSISPITTFFVAKQR